MNENERNSTDRWSEHLEGGATNSQLVWAAAQGYEHLNLLEEAQAEYEAIPRQDCYFLSAQARLVWIHMFRENLQQAVELGALLTRGTRPPECIINSHAHVLHKAGRTQEAYALLAAYPDAFDTGSNDIYARACYATGVGEMEEAAQALRMSYRADDRYWLKSLFDADLKPLWHWGGNGRMTIVAAHVLSDPVFTRVADFSEASRCELPLDYLMKHQAPFGAESHLRVDWRTGFYWLDRRAPVSMRQGYLEWQQAYKSRMIRLARLAIDRATEMMSRA
jgi:hypothetical protein